MQPPSAEAARPPNLAALTKDVSANRGAVDVRRPRRRIRRALIAAALICGLLAVAHGWILSSWAHFLDVSERPQPVDYVLILGGGIATRPFVGAALANQGLAERVLIVQPTLSPDAEDGFFPPDHVLTRRILLKLQVAPERIVDLPGEVTSTYDEACVLERFLRDFPHAKVSVVTNPFHTRRARIIFGRVLKDRMQRVSFVAAPCDGFDESNWWQVEEGARTYVMETLKLFYTLAGGEQ